MFLKKITQKSGRTKLCVYESYREGARTRQRTVRALGYADELAAEHDDPVAWAESVVGETNAEREAERQSAQVETHPCSSSTRGPRTGATPDARRRWPCTRAWGSRPCRATALAGGPSPST